MPRTPTPMRQVRKVRGASYGVARLLGDVEAAAKGPVPYAKRRARRVVYSRANGLLWKLLRGL
jgi:hypothetical protein